MHFIKKQVVVDKFFWEVVKTNLGDSGFEIGVGQFF